MDKKYLYISIVFLLVINAFILYKYYFSYSSIHESYVVNEYRSNSYVSSSNAILRLSDWIASDSLYIENFQEPINSDGKYIFLFFITNGDCSNCILDTIKGIESIDYKLSGHFFLITENVIQGGLNLESFFTRHGILYTNHTGEFKKQFNEINVTQFPLLIIYSIEDNSVIDAFQPEPNNADFLNAFLKRTKHLVSRE